jgi:hypothetical protein
MILLVHETIATSSILFSCYCGLLFDEHGCHLVCVAPLLQKSVASMWNGEIYGYEIVGTFTTH